MGRRRRPRRHERRAASAEAHRAAAELGVRYARRSLAGTLVAWAVTVGLAVVIVRWAQASVFVLGVVGPTRTGAGPLQTEVSDAGAIVVTAALLTAPVALAAIGVSVSGDRARDARQDGPGPLSAWTAAGLGTALALAPNLLGSLLVSGLAPGSDLLFAPQAWPLVAVGLTWWLDDTARDRLSAVRSRPPLDDGPGTSS